MSEASHDAVPAAPAVPAPPRPVEPTRPVEPDSAPPETFGRVDADGTVYVRTPDGERSVGQVPDATPDEALAFFVRRYSALAVEVDLLTARLGSGAVGPDDAAHAIKKIRAELTDAHAVGDLAGLALRLGSLEPRIAEQRAARRADKSKQNEAAKAAKEQMVTEAEKIAAGTDWRGGVNRFRTLLDQWKVQPRLDRTTDDELWHRFSSARTTYTKRRKTQFAQQATERESAKVSKESIISEAEALATSTDWGPTTGAFRDLMQRWKSAGPAPRDVEDALWERFRELQDTFFAAKQQTQDTQDAELGVNGEAKTALLAEFEPQIVPVEHLERSRAAYRTLLERLEPLGQVPRDQVRPLDQRVRALETAIKTADEDRWRRNNPEARARAQDTAAKLCEQIASSEAAAAKAEARGDARGAAKANDAAQTYRSWLAQAEAAVTDFGG